MLKAVCFDLMGTVLYDPYREALRAGTGMDLPAAHRLRDPDAWPDFETGAIDEPTFVSRFWADPDGEHTFDIEAFHGARHAGYRFLPGMAALLEGLDGLLDRYIASNYPVWIEDLRVRFALDDRAEAVFASHQLGVRKPDPAFFARLLDQVPHQAGECLLVDDRQVNCEAAEAAGMPAHLFTDAAGTADRLRKEGVPI